MATKSKSKKSATKTATSTKKGGPSRLTIDRSRWGTGSLLDENGKMCCLGFLASACGVPETAMLDKQIPSDLSIAHRRKIPRWALDDWGRGDEPKSVSDVQAAVQLNDRTSSGQEMYGVAGIRGKKREAHIARIFAKNGIKVTFVDGNKAKAKKTEKTGRKTKSGKQR